ncbi:Nucleotidyltransferase domain protein [Phycisphaerae bacterium RAS1]|nr:Nucleotidyltransferase domain protein [Phycisphaerae bacterium RAS1]
MVARSPNGLPALAAPLDEIVRRIVAAIDPDRIILFGSRARGTARADSDYDLLVVKDTAERTLPLERAAYRAMKGLVAGIDILVETPARVCRLAASWGNVVGDAVREGTTIYERG